MSRLTRILHAVIFLQAAALVLASRAASPGLTGDICGIASGVCCLAAVAAYAVYQFSTEVAL